MIHEIETNWNGAMKFTSQVDGAQVVMDTHDEGMRPKKLMLAALAGCTGMDVIAILKKMKIEPEQFQVRVVGHVTDEQPKHYDKMHLIYEFEGENLPMEKLQKAIDLSQEKYCGVSHVYKQTMPITYEIMIKTPADLLEKIV
jgi:putative redox protein